MATTSETSRATTTATIDMVPPRTTTTILGVAQGMEEVSIVADSHPHMATETQMTMGTVEVAEATDVEGTVQEGRRTTTTIEVDLWVETIMVRPTAIRVEVSGKCRRHRRFGTILRPSPCSAPAVKASSRGSRVSLTPFSSYRKLQLFGWT